MSRYPLKILVVMMASLCAQPSIGLTLAQAYQSALKDRSEVVTSRIDQEIADSRYSLALSQVLPRLSLSSTNVFRDSVGGSATIMEDDSENKVIISSSKENEEMKS